MIKRMWKGNSFSSLTSSDALREVAIGTVITFVLFLSAAFMPLLGALTSVVIPVPTVLVYYRLGPPVGYLLPMGAAFLSWMVLVLFGEGSSIVYLVGLLLLGVLIARGMRYGWSVTRIIGFASLTVFAGGVVVFYLYHGTEGVFSGIEKNIHETIKLLSPAPQEAGVRVSEKTIHIIARLVPGFSLAFIILTAWIDLLLARSYCSIYHILLPDWPPWSQWRSPETLVWVVIGAGFMVLTPSEPIRLLGLNLLIVLSAIYLLHGVAVIGFFLNRWNMPVLARGSIYVLVFLQQFLSIFVMFIGLFDVWFNFRKLTLEDSNQKE